MKPILVTPPTALPLSLQLAKDWLNIFDSGQDTVVDLAMRQAVEHVEFLTNRRFLTQTWSEVFPCWEEVVLRYSPVQSVTSVLYRDEDNASQTLATDQYLLDSTREPARIIPADGVTLPTLYDRPDPITVTYVVGYTSNRESLDRYPISVMLCFLGFFFENRQGQDVPSGLLNLVAPLKVVDV